MTGILQTLDHPELQEVAVEAEARRMRFVPAGVEGAWGSVDRVARKVRHPSGWILSKFEIGILPLSLQGNQIAVLSRAWSFLCVLAVWCAPCWQVCLSTADPRVDSVGLFRIAFA